MKQVDAESIFTAIDNVLSSLKLTWKSVLSVCFDGARSMSGHLNGVQARCKSVNDSILYIHCFAHCLNLVLVDSCTSRISNSEAFDFFGIVQMIYNFIEGGAVRHGVLEDVLKSVRNKVIALKSLSETRWASRAEAVSAITCQLKEIIIAIRKIQDTTNVPETKINASNVLRLVLDFKFVLGLQIFNPILQMILKVSKTLQTANINLLFAMEQIDALKNYLVDKRDDVEFAKNFQQSALICEELNIEPLIEKRKRKVSKKLDGNVNSEYHFEDAEQKYCVNYYYKLFDSVIDSIDKRFNQKAVRIITAAGNLLALKVTEEDMEILTNKFEVSSSELEVEVMLLKSTDQMACNNLAKWTDWLNCFERYTSNPNFTKIIQDFQVLGVTSCTPERTFSKLNLVKTKLRSTMTQDRLDHLLLGFVEQKLIASITADEVIDEFKTLVTSERRMLL